MPETRALPYLPDVARLEWLRQACALAADTDLPAPDISVQARTDAREPARVALLPGLRVLTSRHRVFTIWRYALEPAAEGLVLDGSGENLMLWREDGEVAMAPLDDASFACIAALVRGDAVVAAVAEARGHDPAFDFAGCLASLIRHRVVTAITP